MSSEPIPLQRDQIKISPGERAIIDAMRAYELNASDTELPPLTEASDLLKEVSAAARLTGKKGKLRIEITITPVGEMSHLEVECKAQIPKVKAPKRSVYVTETGEVTTHDPRRYKFADLFQQKKAEPAATA